MFPIGLLVGWLGEKKGFGSVLVIVVVRLGGVGWLVVDVKGGDGGSSVKMMR